MMQENFTLKNLNQLICKLSDLAGIIPSYINYRGEEIEVPLDTKAKILSAMGFSIDEESLSYWIEYFENYPWKNFLEPVYVTDSYSSVIYIYLKNKDKKEISIEISPFTELGQEGKKLVFSFYPDSLTIAEQKILKDEVYCKYSIPLKLPAGYYRMQIFSGRNKGESLLIVAPKECFSSFNGKTWGIHCHLWSLRGREREGDFSHLKEIAEYVSSRGGYVSIDPLHLNDPEDLMAISPYSALSRQFKTPLYISFCPVQERNPHIFDYPYVWCEKIKLLREEFEKFYNKEYLKNSEKASAFLSYKKNLPPVIQKDLKYFAVFCFLREKYGKEWYKWENFRIPDEKSLEMFYFQNEKEMLFYEYLQWLVNEEINELKSYKLCLDLGFGSIKTSFDVWSNQQLYALSAEYGAPPDSFNPNGQKWGFPPWIPYKLKEQGYLPFIKILRSNMNASILRIDHALGVFRGFWIPEGCSPVEGAYVRHPWNDMLGIIALESQINKTEIIGEDLGTAEEWMRQELIKRKICSWRVFYFEKDLHGFKSPDFYPVNAVCSITTHDLPTLKGFWLGRDIELRKELSIFDEIQAEQAIKERQHDKDKIIEMLRCESLQKNFQISSDFFYEEILLNIIRLLSETPSRYLLLYLEDLLLLKEQTNLPGTTLQYPNWQRKLPLTVKEILNLPRLRKIEEILKEGDRIKL